MAKITLFATPLKDEENLSEELPLMEEKQRVDRIEFAAKIERWKIMVDGVEPDIPIMTRKAPLYVGLLDIASVLHKDGFEVTYLPLNLLYARKEFDKAQELLRSQAKESIMVGTTSYTTNITLSEKLMGIAKKSNPETVTVLGGPHPSVMDIDSMKNPDIDIVVRGEGELTARQLAYEIDKTTRDYKKIQGITFRNGYEIIRNPDRSELVDFDDIPLPLLEVVPKEYRNQLLGYVVTSRGCKYNCLFCSESKFWRSKSVRKKTPKRVASELRNIRDYFGQTFVHIADSTFITGGEEFEDKVEALSEIPDMKFSVNMRPDYAPRKMIKRLLEAGVIEFLFGIESASNSVLKTMRKGFRFRDSIETLEGISGLGIPFIGSYWIVGHPGETHKTAIETLEGLRFLYENDLLFNSYSNVYVPLPGTPPFLNPEKYGMTEMPNDWKKFGRYSYPVCDLAGIGRESIFSYYIAMESMKADYLRKHLNEIDLPIGNEIKSMTY